MFKNKLKKLNKSCFRNDCYDEYIGLLAIILGIIGYIIQIEYTEETLDVTSFSIAALFLGCFSELGFAIQGYLKGSITITATRSMTFLGFLTFIVLWFINS
tara:strand:+ start:140 stop:442 length:303 start_codon:yes stop_codon:yes gene_type:complete